MSYILDALRKSEQARQQNASTQGYSLLPGIDEQIVVRRSWPYLLAAALLVNAAVFYFWLRPMPARDSIAIKESAATRMPQAPVEQKAATAPASPRDKPASAMAGSMPDTDSSRSHSEPVANSPGTRIHAAIPVTAAALSRPRTEPAPETRVARIPTPAQAPAPASAPASAAPPQAPREIGKQSKPAAVAPPAPRSREKSAPPADAAVATVAKPVAAVTAAPQQEPGGQGVMPLALQKELPALSVTGIIRDQSSGGMAIVNDRMLREGDEVAPGVKLEKIEDNGLVFSYKGYRFTR